MLALRPGYDYAAEFEFGLSLILDALHPDEVEGSTRAIGQSVGAGGMFWLSRNRLVGS